MPTDNASSAPADLPAKGPLHGSALAVSVADLPGVVYRCRHDKDRTMLGLPETVQDLTGYTPEELIHNRQLRFSELIHPEDRERVRGEIREAIQSERPFRVPYRIRRRDGEERWVLEDGREADQGKGGETSDEQILVGYIQDITVPPASRLAKVQDEVETIRRQARRLKLLQEVTAIANRERRVEAAVGLALPKVCRAFGFSMGQVFLGGEGDLRKGNPPFEAARVWHVLEDHGEFSSLREGTGGCEWDIEKGLPQRVLRAGSSEWVEDVGEDPGLLRSTPNGACPVVSGVGFPVMSGERSIGVVAIYSRKAVADDAEVRQLLEQIGLQLGRVWEREEGSRNLRVAEGWLRQLAHNVEAVLWLSNLEGEILYLSPGFEKLTGGRAPISHWRELMEIVHPEDRSRLENLFIQTDRVPYKIEYRILVDGEARWIRQKGFPVENHAGEVYRVGGLAEDVTAHRRTLQDLEEATRFLERTISSLAEGVLVIDTSGDGRKVLEVNRAVEEMFGYRREELVGRTTEHLHVDRDSFLNFGKEGNPVLEEKGVFRTAYPMKRKDGTVFQAEQTVTLLDPIRGLTGGAVSVVRDISERETAISRLRESEERFRQIAEYIDDIFWIRSPEMDRVEYVSPAYQEIVGRPVEELYDDPSAWLSQVHPEDQERVLMSAERSAEGGFEEEYRIIREDGEVRWIWDRAFPVRNAKGEVYRLLGVAEDITDRKELEGQLLQSKKNGSGRQAGRRGRP